MDSLNLKLQIYLKNFLVYFLRVLQVVQNVTTTSNVTFNNITANANISSSGGTGSFGSLKVDGSSVDFSGLPTSDPGVAGRLYNDSGTIKISL